MSDGLLALPLRTARYRVLATAATAVAVASVVATLRHGVPRADVSLGVAFGCLVLCGELARVVLPGDRESAPLAQAAALGLALTFTLGGHPVHLYVPFVVAVVAVGSALGALVHGAVGRTTGLPAIGRRVLTTAALAASFSGVPALLHVTSVRPLRLTLVLSVFAGLAVTADLVLAAFDRTGRQPSPLLAAVRDEVTAGGALAGAVGATGVLMALASPLMGLWALPALSATLLVAQFSLRRYSGIRATYRQTIRALSRMTEVGGYVNAGHSTRVAALAVATGRALGMPESELLDLEYAALMHDIGQLSLAEPIPGGSTLVVPPVERRHIAELGAEVIRSTGVLDHVADVVERQADPYRRNRRPADASLPLASRIIKAASAYDDIVAGNPTEPTVRADALERLRLGMAYEYDPRVVDALARVVGGQAYEPARS